MCFFRLVSPDDPVSLSGAGGHGGPFREIVARKRTIAGENMCGLHTHDVYLTICLLSGLCRFVCRFGGFICCGQSNKAVRRVFRLHTPI